MVTAKPSNSQSMSLILENEAHGINRTCYTNREYGAAEWLLIFAWLPGSGLLRGTIGWAAGQVVGPTQKELAGGMAGAVIGLFGGLFYSPLIGHIIEPMKDPDLEFLRRAAIGATLGLVVGAVSASSTTFCGPGAAVLALAVVVTLGSAPK